MYILKLYIYSYIILYIDYILYKFNFSKSKVLDIFFFLTRYNGETVHDNKHSTFNQIKQK